MFLKSFIIFFILIVNSFNPCFGIKMEDTLLINDCNNSARDFIIKGNYLKADSLVDKAYNLSVKIDYETGQFNALTNKGVIFWYQDNYPKSLEYYFKALRVAEQLQNQLFVSRCLANIGLVYSSKNDFKKSLSYYQKALIIKQRIGDVKAEAIILSNIAQILNDQGDFKNALDYYFKALEKDKLLQNSDGLVALNLVGIGSVYKKQSNIKLAADYFDKSIKIADSLNDKVLQSNVLLNIGDLYLIKGEYKVAEKHLLKALDISSEIGDLNNIKDAYFKLSELYEKTNQYNLSLINYENYMKVQDSIFNVGNTKKEVQLEMNFEFEKQQAISRLEQEKIESIRKAESKRQQIILWSIVCVLILVLGFTFYVFKNYKEKKKINLEITLQKHVIEEKQKEILDSIYYASRIQKALMTSERYFDKNLNRLNNKNKIGS